MLADRQQWQEAERKLAEAQVSTSRLAEEMGHRVRSLESALAQAKEEAKQAVQKADTLATQLASAQDAVKVGNLCCEVLRGSGQAVPVVLVLPSTATSYDIHKTPTMSYPCMRFSKRQTWDIEAGAASRKRCTLHPSRSVNTAFSPSDVRAQHSPAHQVWKQLWKHCTALLSSMTIRWKLSHCPPPPPQIKVAMLDSAHDTISSLKAELQDLAAEADEARRAAEDIEVQAARQQEADAQEKANLRWGQLPSR